MSKLKLWDSSSSWEEAEKKWESEAKSAAEKKSLKGLKTLPQVQGITKETARFLKLKSAKYMILHDKKARILRYVLKRPFYHFKNYLFSVFKKKSFLIDGDFYLYGLNSVEQFQNLLKEKQTLLVVGFSYCQKPHECPSGRFTDQCLHDPTNLICKQCPIGKVVHAMPSKQAIPLFIPTIHYIGEKIFEIKNLNPSKKVIFIITACELTLEMFGDLGNMVQIQGIGVRLDGRICNTMKAFELSEAGIKPGLTVVTEPTQKRILDLIRLRREAKLDET